MVNNIPVNGWPQLKDLEAVQPTLDRLDKIEDWKRTVKEETFTGDDITIENALALPARSLITEINAIQDLHGLPFPYVGGAYKNKLPMTVESIKAANTSGIWSGNEYTLNGLTFTIQTDSADNVVGIKVDGTASGQVIFDTGASIPDANGQYIINGCPNTGSSTTYSMQIKESGVWSTANYGGDNVINIDNKTITVFIVIRVDYVCPSSGLLFKPMIRLSTESDPTFAPYSNICPISGRDRVAVDDLPNADYVPFFEGVKNGTYGFVDLGTLNWKYNSTNGFFWLDPDALPNKQLGNLSCAIYNYVGAKTDAQMATVDNMSIALSSGNNIKVKNTSYTDATTFTTAMSGVYLIYELATPTTPSYTAEQWVALVNSFGGNNVTIQLGQTVYGADINWDTGVMDVNHGDKTLNGSENITWSITNTDSAQIMYANLVNLLPGVKTTGRYQTTTDWEMFKTRVFGVSPEVGDAWIDSNTRVDVCFAFPLGSFADSAAFNTWLTSNNIKFTYELATPTTIQLTPEQLQMLKGYNRVTLSDGYGTIELKALTGANWS